MIFFLYHTFCDVIFVKKWLNEYSILNKSRAYMSWRLFHTPHFSPACWLLLLLPLAFWKFNWPRCQMQSNEIKMWIYRLLSSSYRHRDNNDEWVEWMRKRNFITTADYVTLYYIHSFIEKYEWKWLEWMKQVARSYNYNFFSYIFFHFISFGVNKWSN